MLTNLGPVQRLDCGRRNSSLGGTPKARRLSRSSERVEMPSCCASAPTELVSSSINAAWAARIRCSSSCGGRRSSRRSKKPSIRCASAAGSRGPAKTSPSSGTNCPAAGSLAASATRSTKSLAGAWTNRAQPSGNSPIPQIRAVPPIRKCAARQVGPVRIILGIGSSGPSPTLVCQSLAWVKRRLAHSGWSQSSTASPAARFTSVR